MGWKLFASNFLERCSVNNADLAPLMSPEICICIASIDLNVSEIFPE